LPPVFFAGTWRRAFADSGFEACSAIVYGFACLGSDRLKVYPTLADGARIAFGDFWIFGLNSLLPIDNIVGADRFF
jgi:hypothetical protein